MSQFEVLTFIAEVLRKIPTGVGRRETRPILAEKLVKILSLRSAEIYLF